MWSQWDGKQIDPRMAEWAAGREMTDKGMCTADHGSLDQSEHDWIWCDRDWTVVSVLLRCWYLVRYSGRILASFHCLGTVDV